MWPLQATAYCICDCVEAPNAVTDLHDAAHTEQSAYSTVAGQAESHFSIRQVSCTNNDDYNTMNLIYNSFFS